MRIRIAGDVLVAVRGEKTEPQFYADTPLDIELAEVDLDEMFESGELASQDGVVTISAQARMRIRIPEKGISRILSDALQDEMRLTE